MKQTAIVGPRDLKAAQVHGVASDLLGCIMFQVPGLLPSEARTSGCSGRVMLLPCMWA